MKSIGIKYQLRITTLIPIFTVVVLLAIFYNNSFNNDLKQHITRLGEAYTRQLLPAAQYALLQNDIRTLQSLSNASVANPEVMALAFYSHKGQLLAYRGGNPPLNIPFTPPKYTGDYIEQKQINSCTVNFTAPVIVSKFNLYSTLPDQSVLNPIISRADDILGWLSINIDTQPLIIKRYQKLMITIFITLFGLLIGLIIHYFLSKRIHLPLTRLHRSMKQILRNEFTNAIKTTSSGELGIIEQGCAHLQKKHLELIRDLNQYIEVATTRLELLEEKNIELSLEKKTIEEKSRQKSEFIANMSHEIRTPMNGVIGFTNVLLESKLDPLQLDYVKTIKSSAQDLLGIINNILDFSKIEAERLHLECIPLNIRHCIEEVITLLTPSADNKGIDLIAITEFNVPKIFLGDPLRIKQIMSNLVTNAVKFTEHGHVSINTKIEQETDKEYIISITVTDTGLGISPEAQRKLFTAFNQADSSITRRYGGSGLGLVICKKLCEEMSGCINFTSELNKGSSFTAQIKVAKLASFEMEKNQPHHFSHFKMLCFDENSLHLSALCNGLGYWGIQCVPVASFNQLENALKQNKDCKIAFLSVNKTVEQKMAQLIAKHNYFPYVLISKWLIEDITTLGAQGFLHKPLSIQKVHDLIELLSNQENIKPSTNYELDHLREQLHLIHPDLLIAEDNPINKMLLSSLLGTHANITFVDNGEIAVSACHDKKYHLILLDLQMPKLNGLEAARLIHQSTTLNRHTPMMLLSANCSEVNNADLKNSGIDFCLQKPIDEKQLLLQIIHRADKTEYTAIDWQLCLHKVSGNHDLAEEFLACFVEDLYKNREEFIHLLHEKNIKKLGEAAHKLHGACCFCGVPTLQKKVAYVEKLAAQGASVEEMSIPFSELIQSIDAVINEYETPKITT